MVKVIKKKLQQHANDLQQLHRSNGTVQKAILKTGKASLVKTLVLIAGNILEGVVKLTPTQKTKLAKYASAMRELVKGPNSSVKSRKQLLVKKTNMRGGFLQFLIAPIAAAIGGLLGSSSR